MLRHVSVLACASLLIGLSSPSPAGAQCNAARGDRVVLASNGSLDPDVFVWDSMQRLVDYAGGADDVDTVMRHTTLASAGTHAVVLNCRPSAARLHVTNAFIDLVGVKLVDGRYRGRFGWIFGTDARRDSKMPNVSPTAVNHSQ